MENPSDIRRPADRPERKHQRFAIRYPVQLKLPLGSAISELQAVSNNVSVEGVLLETDLAIPQHSDVNFVIMVHKHDIAGPIRLVGAGEVVRVEPHPSGAGFAIAVRCERPISQLEDYLPASES